MLKPQSGPPPYDDKRYFFLDYVTYIIKWPKFCFVTHCLYHWRGGVMMPLLLLWCFVVGSDMLTCWSYLCCLWRQSEYFWFSDPPPLHGSTAPVRAELIRILRTVWVRPSEYLYIFITTFAFSFREPQLLPRLSGERTKRENLITKEIKQNKKIENEANFE